MPISETLPNLLPVDECKTDEQRLKRIIQEIFIKNEKAQNIIRSLLILAGFTEDTVTEKVVLSYNPLNPEHLDILQKKCISKADNIFLNREIKQGYHELNGIRIAILQLTRSSMIIARSIWIRKHAWKILLILSGLGLALSACKNEDKT